MKNLFSKRITLLEGRYGILVDVYEPQGVLNENNNRQFSDQTQDVLPVFSQSLINQDLISTSQEYLYRDTPSFKETYFIPYVYRSQYGFVQELDLYDGSEINIYVSLKKRIPERNSKLICLLQDDRKVQFRVYRSHVIAGLKQKQAITIVNLKPYS